MDIFIKISMETRWKFLIRTSVSQAHTHSWSLFNIINYSHLAYFKYQLKIINFNEYVNIFKCLFKQTSAEKKVFFTRIESFIESHTC